MVMPEQLNRKLRRLHVEVQGVCHSATYDVFFKQAGTPWYSSDNLL